MSGARVTEAHLAKAEAAWGKYAQCVDYMHREAAIDSIAQALADAEQDAREGCAQLCENLFEHDAMAAAIRARGQS